MSEARCMQEKYEEAIEKLEEDLEFLKAARTIMQYVDRKVETFEEALQDARRSYEYWHDRVLTEE